MFSEKAYVGLGRVPVGIGAILHGWDITDQEFRENSHVVDFRAMTEKCPHDCFHCFTDKNRRTLTFAQIKRIIDELAELKTNAIDFLGEGEPTIDPYFFDIVEYTAAKGIVPIIFTDCATKLRDINFIRRLKDAGASVCPKCDSLFNAEYQDWIVGDKTGKYFYQRNDALALLMEAGFNKIEPDGTTRLGFVMVISSRNIAEVPETLRFCRKHNLWIVFSFFLPAGRSARADFNHKLEPDIKSKQEMREMILSIDRDEFGFTHKIWNNFATMPCVERLQIYGDGRVSPCSGNETIVGRIQDYTIQELHQIITDQFPGHNPACFDGNCLYRTKI
jgi:MoaA/NifB/PqqE/SkfB family radical SAM enzyme